MKLKNKNAEIFVPDGKSSKEALERTDIMSINAHQDDIEISAFQGIVECFGRDDKWFTGIIVTDGSGSARDGIYAGFTDKEMQIIRTKEQKKAAILGEYSAVALLNYSSAAIKNPDNKEAINEIANLIKIGKPKTVYTHNLADKHDTHVGVVIKTLMAIRSLPKEDRPEKLYGCEVWRDLDWVKDDEKIIFDVSSHPNLASSLVEVFDSQIAGGKRYDLATIGRRRANATYATSHGVDEMEAAIYGIDLTPLIEDDSLDIIEYIIGYIENFKNDVKNRLKKLV
jgi:LmbE family N-acetylglucosaminyl deacetylase